MALVGPRGVGSILLSWPKARLIREPHEDRSGGDVLFCGPGMAQEVRRFPIESDIKLSPVAVAASGHGPGLAGLYGMGGRHGR
jgi:hypothetical protein